MEKPRKINADRVLMLTIEELQRLRKVNTEALSLACGIVLGVSASERGFSLSGAHAWLDKRLRVKSSPKPRKKRADAKA